VNLLAGSSIIVAIASKIFYSISSPLKFLTLSKNYCGLPIAYYAFFQTFSSPSLFEILSPYMINTTLDIVETAGGGETNAFISPICFLSKQSTAVFALSIAGKALANSVAAISDLFLASAAAILVISSS
jgi:hypothetical protein